MDTLTPQVFDWNAHSKHGLIGEARLQVCTHGHAQACAWHIGTHTLPISHAHVHVHVHALCMCACAYACAYACAC